MNKGAYLMLVACLEQIKKHYPQAVICLAPNKNSPYLSRAAIGALQKVSFRLRGIDLNVLSYFMPLRLKQFLQHWFGFVFESDVDLILDASGFAYGDQWGGRNVRLLGAEIRRLKRHKAGYILLPQAFGPFSKPADKQALAQGLPQALLVCARDEQSFQYLKECAPEADIQQFADFTNLVAPRLPEFSGYQQLPQSYGLIIPNSAMLGPRNRNSAWREHYLQLLITAAGIMRQLGITPIVLNHEGEADAALCQQLLAAVDGIQIVSPAHPAEVKGWIAAAKLVVCSRFHGCVSALSSGVPCIGTSWSHKYEMLFAEYEQQHALIKPETSETELRALFATVMAEQNVQVLEQRAAFWQIHSDELWQLVIAKIQQAIDSGQVQIKSA
ncbi:polysaccharide pyruvyl transferase family protein [Rheinheimera sp.]|uniref:polysaccharide pyruvyl transferase family protein n=1 Tax=Rheinheimera sp. TaxID=1869214 RepID=UPI003D268839